MEDATFVIGLVKFRGVWSDAPTDSKKCLSGRQHAHRRNNEIDPEVCGKLAMSRSVCQSIKTCHSTMNRFATSALLKLSERLRPGTTSPSCNSKLRK